MFRKSELCFKADERYDTTTASCIKPSDLVHFGDNTPTNSAAAPTMTKVFDFLGD
jgi:hypothetical protein